MVTVGTLELGVNVKNAIESRKKVEQVKQGYQETAEEANNVSDNTSVYSSVLSTASDILSGTVTRLQRFSSWLGISTSATTLLTRALGGLTAVFGLVQSAISLASYSSLVAAYGTLASAVGTAVSAITALLGAIGAVVGISAGAVAAIIAVIAVIAGLASEILGITDVTPISKKAVIDFANTIGGKVKSLAIGAFKAIANAIKNLIKSATSAAIQFVKDKIKGLIETVRSIPSKVKSGVTSLAPDINAPNVSIPSLDGGGIIEKDGIAMVHKNEAVVPLDNMSDTNQNSDASGGDDSVDKTVNNDITVRAKFEESGIGDMSVAERRRFINDIADSLASDIEGRIE